MSTKKVLVPKLVVALHIARMNAEARVTFARATANTAKTSPTFMGSPAAQSSMDTWQKASDALDANNLAIAAAEKVLETVRGQEAGLTRAFDLAAAGYAATVRSLAANDATVVSSMGLATRSEPKHVTSIEAPTALRVVTTRAGIDALTWAKVAGARLYCAEISVDPATEESFTALPGGGRKRKLSGPGVVGLVHGQKYVLRVRALGATLESSWSASLSYVGK